MDRLIEACVKLKKSHPLPDTGNHTTLCIFTLLFKSKFKSTVLKSKSGLYKQLQV